MYIDLVMILSEGDTEPRIQEQVICWENAPGGTSGGVGGTSVWKVKEDRQAGEAPASV